MDKSHQAWPHGTAGQFPAYTDQQSEPALHLMPIEMSGNTNVFNRDPDVFAFMIFHGEAFIGHRDVPGQPSQGLTQSARRSRGVIDQPEPSNFSLLTEVKSKILVLQRSRGDIEKPDLRWDTEPGIN